MIKVQLPNGKTFDAVQWTGEREELPEWLGHNRIEADRFYGQLLCVGWYFVKPKSWVLRSDDRGDTFPVPGDMMWNVYEPVTNVTGADNTGGAKT